MRASVPQVSSPGLKARAAELLHPSLRQRTLLVGLAWFGSTCVYYGVALSTGLTVEEAATWPDRVLAVTPEQVNAAARKYLKKERSVTGVLKRPEEDA